jgi:hypothetical protein
MRSLAGLRLPPGGGPRATHDIDFAIAIGTKEPDALAAFMEGRYDAGGPDDPLKGVIRATVTVGATSVPLQLVFLPATFTDATFEQIEMLSIMNHRVPVVNWATLVLLKLYAGEPQDILDAKQILIVRQPAGDELTRLSALADRLGLREEWIALSGKDTL